MRSLITGGAGFIGAEVTRELVERGEDLPAVFSRNPSRKRLDDVADRVEIIQGDLGNFSHVLAAVKKVKPEVIYHLGAMLSIPSDADPATALSTNALGTFHVLEAARLFDVRQVLFASSIGAYGRDIHDETIGDDTIQRPLLFYGATKVFSEHMGLFYKRKYGLDFRGIRYPSIVGAGVRTQGIDHYTSWAIEESAKGNAYTIYVEPYTRIPMVYVNDAAKAIIRLGEAPLQNIKTVNYLIDGVTPTPSAGELADAIRARLPGARIDFHTNLEYQQILDEMLRPLDDSNARSEWGWTPKYDVEAAVSDLINEIALHPQRYD